MLVMYSLFGYFLGLKLLSFHSCLLLLTILYKSIDNIQEYHHLCFHVIELFINHLYEYSIL
jgi:hypothetical protein